MEEDKTLEEEIVLLKTLLQGIITVYRSCNREVRYRLACELQEFIKKMPLLTGKIKGTEKHKKDI